MFVFAFGHLDTCLVASLGEAVHMHAFSPAHPSVTQVKLYNMMIGNGGNLLMGVIDKRPNWQQ